MSTSKEVFKTIKIEGSLIPSDFLLRIKEQDKEVKYLVASSYHIPEGESIKETISRSWNRLLGLWGRFKERISSLPNGNDGVDITLKNWLLPFFEELKYGYLTEEKTPCLIDDKAYSISCFYKSIPINLLSFKVDIDKRSKEFKQFNRVSPHSMMQEYLNRKEESLWAFICNGLKLRVLRDNISLSRQAYIEFDLETMMNEKIYPDFVMLWMICHQSRINTDHPQKSILEVWKQQATYLGTRALNDLRNGVQKAIEILGQGFLEHRENSELRDQLKKGVLSTQGFYQQLLRIVYRMIFLLVSEERDILLRPDVSEEGKEIYNRYYALSRLKNISRKMRGTRHHDLWDSIITLFNLLESEGYQKLGIPPLGSFLWSQEAVTDLYSCKLENRSLLPAIYQLSFVEKKRVRRQIDWQNTGSEELGSIYESLLEMVPEIDHDCAEFKLKIVSGNERKTTGSYYTPGVLINSLLDSALEPVLKQALQEEQPEQAILNLKICDPAAGSGHFLVAAAHRIAKQLAYVRTGAFEPSPVDMKDALRDVISHCIYGVDINPMSVELCKVSLWMEAQEPGKPLSFLDHHIKCGNSLLGTTPDLLKKDLPDNAFTVIAGDDKKICSEYKKRNKAIKSGKKTLFSQDGSLSIIPSSVIQKSININQIDDGDIKGVREKKRAYQRLIQSVGYQRAKFYADAWCSGFVWPKITESDAAGNLTFWPLTNEELHRIKKGDLALPEWMIDEVNRLADEYQFFHWYLEFPEVFQQGGFDCLLGNPPWESSELKEKEFFAPFNKKIANASKTSERNKLIEQLKYNDPEIYSLYQNRKRFIKGVTLFIKGSNAYPLSQKGKVNTYAIFSELSYKLRRNSGTIGIIIPSGIATDDTNKHFFQKLIKNNQLKSLFDFENRKAIFQDVHRSFKFSLLTISSGYQEGEFVFFALDEDDLSDPQKRFTLSQDDIALINPNTKTCPIFRTQRDAEITKGVYQKIPVLINEELSDGNLWDVSFKQGLFNMSSDSHLFHTKEMLDQKNGKLVGNHYLVSEKRFLPLYEAKMIHHFDHRWATYEGEKARDITIDEKNDPEYLAQSRYWVAESDFKDVTERFNSKYFIGFRDITNITNERTVIFSMIPKVSIGHTLPLVFCKNGILLIGLMNSFVVDYIARQKVGGTHLTYSYLKQLPVLKPSVFNEKLLFFITPRVLELTYTAVDLKDFATDLGYDGPPFEWNVERRFQIRCELDALYFHLYGIKREDVAYIMDTFPIVRRKDEEQYGVFRTKERILEVYDQMNNGVEQYISSLTPAPGCRD